MSQTKNLGRVVGLISSTQAPSVTEVLWFDTANNFLMFYNYGNSAWEAVGSTALGLVKMNVGDTTDYLDTKIDGTTIGVNGSNKLEVINPVTPAQIENWDNTNTIILKTTYTAMLAISATDLKDGDICFINDDGYGYRAGYYWTGISITPNNQWIKFFGENDINTTINDRIGTSEGELLIAGSGGLGVTGSIRPAIVLPNAVSTQGISSVEARTAWNEDFGVDPGDVPEIGAILDEGRALRTDANGKLISGSPFISNGDQTAITFNAASFPDVDANWHDLGNVLPSGFENATAILMRVALSATGVNTNTGISFRAKGYTGDYTSVDCDCWPGPTNLTNKGIYNVILTLNPALLGQIQYKRTLPIAYTDYIYVSFLGFIQ